MAKTRSLESLSGVPCSLRLLAFWGGCSIWSQCVATILSENGSCLALSFSLRSRCKGVHSLSLVTLISGKKRQQWVQAVMGSCILMFSPRAHAVLSFEATSQNKCAFQTGAWYSLGSAGAYSLTLLLLLTMPRPVALNAYWCSRSKQDHQNNENTGKRSDDNLDTSDEEQYMDESVGDKSGENTSQWEIEEEITVKTGPSFTDSTTPRQDLAEASARLSKVLDKSEEESVAGDKKEDHTIVDSEADVARQPDVPVDGTQAFLRCGCSRPELR